MLSILRQLNKHKLYISTTTAKCHNERLFTTKPRTIVSTKQSTAIPPSFNKNAPRNDGDYFVRLQNNPDMFGPQSEPPIHGKDDVSEEQHLSNREKPIGKQLSTKQYADIIKGLINKKKIKEAIDVVEVRMLKEDKVQPEKYLYNLLLGACGKVGYTKKAFQLYNDMKKRGLQIHPGAYTALFNACSNSPWPEDGLTRAKHLHNIMIEKGYQPNDSNYHSMIKAYGRCGDINAAFSLVDEIISKRLPIKEETLNFLMQACITDKEAGFRHILLVWRKFITKRIKPSVYTYNLLLRATRDCGLGDIEATKDVLKQILPKNDRLQLSQKEELQVPVNNDEAKFPLATKEIEGGLLTFDEALPSGVNRPNLLAEQPQLGDIVLIDQITRAEDRLLLLGGAQNFIDDMQKHSCQPDIKTFTQLLDCIPSTLTAEKDLLMWMKKHKIQPDIDFYNMLIKKRSMRFDYAGAKDVLVLIHKDKFLPDLITYGILALGCKNKTEAQNFIYEMEAAKYRMNAEILGAMLQQSTYHFDFQYVLYVMDHCVKENIQPNATFMERLDKFYNKCKKISNDTSHSLGNSKKFQKGFQIFKMRLKAWREQAHPEKEVHPWQQFRENVNTDVRHYAEDKSSDFKKRYASKYRQKQVPVDLVQKPAFRSNFRRKSITPTKPKTDEWE